MTSRETSTRDEYRKRTCILDGKTTAGNVSDGMESQTTQVRDRDLIEHFQHEHVHLNRLLTDVAETFGHIAAGTLRDEALEDAVETALGDLEEVLEEMLHHFDHEEEVFFVFIAQRFPEYADRIATLTASHEEMYELTKTLQRQVSERRQLVDRAPLLRSRLQRLQALVDEHNTQEGEVFARTIETLSRDDRRRLFEELRRL